MISVRKIHCLILGFLLSTSTVSKAMETENDTPSITSSNPINYEAISTYKLIKKFSWQDAKARQMLADKVIDGTLIIEYYHNTFASVAPKLLETFQKEKMTDLSDEELFLFVSLSKEDRVYKNVLPIIQDRIEQGSMKARLVLAHLYENGKGVEKNVQKVCELYESVGIAANGVALINLGLMYQYPNDSSILKDSSKAEHYFRQAAELGNIRGKMELADFLFKRDGASLKSTEIFSLYTEAALGGIDYANHALGSLYFHLGELETGTKWFLNVKLAGPLRNKVNFWFFSQRHKVILYYSLYDREGSQEALDHLKYYMKESTFISPETIQKQEESINKLVQHLTELENNSIFLEDRSGVSFNEKLFGENKLLVEKSQEINKLVSDYKRLVLSLLEPGTLVSCLDVEKWGHCDEGTIGNNMKVIYDEFEGDDTKYIMLNALRNKRLQQEIDLKLLGSKDLMQNLMFLQENLNFIRTIVLNLMNQLMSLQEPISSESVLKEKMELNLSKSDAFNQNNLLESLRSYFNKFPYEGNVQSQLQYLTELTRDIIGWETILIGNLEFALSLNQYICCLIKNTVDLRNSILYKKLGYGVSEKG